MVRTPADYEAEAALEDDPNHGAGFARPLNDETERIDQAIGGEGTMNDVPPLQVAGKCITCKDGMLVKTNRMGRGDIPVLAKIQVFCRFVSCEMKSRVDECSEYLPRDR